MVGDGVFDDVHSAVLVEHHGDYYAGAHVQSRTFALKLKLIDCAILLSVA